MSDWYEWNEREHQRVAHDRQTIMMGALVSAFALSPRFRRFVRKALLGVIGICLLIFAINMFSSNQPVQPHTTVAPPSTTAAVPPPSTTAAVPPPSTTAAVPPPSTTAAVPPPTATFQPQQPSPTFRSPPGVPLTITMQRPPYPGGAWTIYQNGTAHQIADSQIGDDTKRAMGNNTRATFRGHVGPDGHFSVEGRVN
jgi:hypothetical protein